MQIAEIQIVNYRTEFKADIIKLNLEWLDKFGLTENYDYEFLNQPEKYVLNGGGMIFCAICDGRVFGTCAAVLTDPKKVELAKLAVSPPARGFGIGRKLSEKVIEFAVQKGVEKVFLISNTKLVAALKLYESLGFKNMAIPEFVCLETANVYMELEISDKKF
ncbi:MAG: GNAT family N-acetyltransferase [Pyrinomonadaceae bacterium]